MLIILIGLGVIVVLAIAGAVVAYKEKEKEGVVLVVVPHISPAVSSSRPQEFSSNRCSTLSKKGAVPRPCSPTEVCC